MTKYYQIYDDYYLDYGITSGPTLPDGSIMAGKTVEANDLPELIYKINVPDDEACPHFMSGGTLIVSELFVKVLQSEGINNFQTFPAILINPDTQKKRTGYFLFNVLSLVSTANLEQSSFDMLMDRGDAGDLPIVALEELSLDSKKISGLRLFRLAEDPAMLIVDESIKFALKQNRPEEGWGVIFEELDAE